MQRAIDLHKKEILIISVVYLIAHGMILLNKGIFWDDWVFYLNKTNIMTLTREIGNPGQSFFIGLLLNTVNGPVIGRFITFFSFYFAAIFLYLTIRKIEKISPISRLFLVLIFAVFPVNMARIAMVDVFYSFCFMLFFLGLWLVSIVLTTHKVPVRLASLGVFFISFFTNSILVFYALVILYIAFSEKTHVFELKKTVRSIFAYLDYLLLPILFWIIKSIFFIPTGHYANYNKLTLNGILKSPSLMMTTFNTSFIQVLKTSILGSDFQYYLLGILFGIGVIWLIHQKNETSKHNRTWIINLGLALFGVAVFLMAIFPYNALRLMPSVSDWNSRHQLLVPLGAAMMICFGAEFFLRFIDKKGRISILVLSVITMMFIRVNLLGYFDYQRDWYKQLGIITNLKTSDIIRNHSTFLITDNYSYANAFGRTNRFYEYSGYMRFIFQNETRIMISESDFNNKHVSDINAYTPYFESYYNLGAYIAVKPEYNVEINKGSINIDDRGILMKEMFDDWLIPGKFNAEAIRFIDLKMNEIK